MHGLAMHAECFCAIAAAYHMPMHPPKNGGISGKNHFYKMDCDVEMAR